MKNVEDDFRDFMKSDCMPPVDLSEKILAVVRKDLNPSAWSVFAKLLGTHAVVGTLSLSICDQFGMNPFSSGFSLSEYFMRFGHSICMTLCGFLFLSLSIFFAWIYLRPEEMKVLWRNSWLQLPSLALLSLVAFALFGGEILLSIGVLWFLGAVTGGFVSTFLAVKRLAL